MSEPLPTRRAGILVGAGLVTLVSLAAAALVMKGSPAQSAATPTVTAQKAVRVFYDMPPMLINVRAPGATQAVLKLRLTLELYADEDVARIERAQPRIIDTFIGLLRDMRVEDFEGPGLQRVRGELTKRLQLTAAPSQTPGLLFKEIMIQ